MQVIVHQDIGTSRIKTNSFFKSHRYLLRDKEIIYNMEIIHFFDKLTLFEIFMDFQKCFRRLVDLVLEAGGCIIWMKSVIKQC